jgi:tRNA-dihydrouridine synthase
MLSPVDLITVHLRYADNFHKGAPDLETAKRLRDKIKVKYVLNGGIDSVIKARQFVSETCCDGLMLGRPAFSELALVRKLVNCFAGRETEEGVKNEKEMIISFFKAISEDGHMGRLKKMVPYVIKNAEGSKELRMKLFYSKTPGEFIEVLKEQLDNSDTGLL